MFPIKLKISAIPYFDFNIVAQYNFNMLEFCHVVTGAALASQIHSPLMSLPLCLASNFVIDLLPHWNPHLFTEKQKSGRLSKKTILFLFSDAFLGLILGLWIAFGHYPDIGKTITIIIGAFLAVSGDLIEAPFYLFNWRNKYIEKLIAFQRRHQWNVSFWPGMLFQIVYTLLFLFIAGKI